MLIEKFYDGILSEIDLKALHLGLDPPRCKALPNLYPP
jgi:hypothetical protein